MNIECIPFGDRAILINFPQRIEEEINQGVIQLAQVIESAQWPEIEALIPAYCSLTVCFRPQLTNFAALREKMDALILQIKEPPESHSSRKINVPVCYGGEYGPDLDEVAEQKEMTPSEVIKLHTQEEFRVYMLGFLPGFAYMGKLPPALQVNRKDKPRLKVAAGSVGLAGFQTGIYPSEAPGGWQIIGRTPLELFSSQRKHPFLFQPGDIVQFFEIDGHRFEEISEEMKRKEFSYQEIYG